MPKMSGVYRTKTGLWQVDKIVHGRRLRERFAFERDAVEWLLKKCLELDRVIRFGDPPQLTFAAAVARRLKEKFDADKPSAKSDSYHLQALLPSIGHLKLSEISDASFDEFRRICRSKGKSAKTQHLSLSAAQAILNMAARVWRDPISNLPYLQNPPKLNLPSLQGKQRRPRPISRAEEARLVAELPDHLQAMAIFAVNTGARDHVIVNLRWEWLVDLGQRGLNPIFIVPREYVKGRIAEKVLTLNRIALQIVEKQQGRNTEFVFAWSKRQGSGSRDETNSRIVYRPVSTMNNTAWQAARTRAGLEGLHVHDLRHTFATRLARAGVPKSTISQLMWHSTKDVTEHYMGSDLLALQQAVQAIEQATSEEDVSLVTMIADIAHRRTRSRGSS